MLRLNTGVGPAAMRYHRRMALKHARTRAMEVLFHLWRAHRV